MKPLGTFLANLRSSMGLSLDELAKLVGTSRSTLSRLENDMPPRPFKGSVRKLLIDLAEILCSSSKESEQYIGLADLERALLTETEKVQLGFLPSIVASSASESSDLDHLYHIVEQRHERFELWEQQVRQLRVSATEGAESKVLVQLRRKKQESALLLRDIRRRLDLLNRQQAPSIIPSIVPVAEHHLGEGVHVALARYLEQQQTRMLDALAPGLTNLRVRDIVSKDGLFIQPTWKASQNAIATLDLIEYLIDALIQGQQILLLGEAGQGKTTILKQVFTMMVERFLSRPHKNTPLSMYIPLRELSFVTSNALELLWAYVRDEFPLPFEEFVAMIRSFRIVFLLDGFDEMPGELTQRSVNERASSKIFALPAILTCRKNFYEFYLSMSSLQGQYSQQVELLPLPLTQPVTQYIAAFCHRKQERLLHDSIVPSEHIVETIRADQGLLDLAQRPLLLAMMLDIFTDLQELHTSKWDMARLYQKYTEKWLKNEATKPDSVLRWNEKAALMQEVAWSLYVKRGTALSSYEQYQSGTFTQHDLFHMLERFASRYQHISLTQLVDDICLRTFLIANEGDNYYFIHKSFQEYYVAKYIFECLRNSKQYTDTVAYALQEFLSFEIGSFLKAMLSAKEFSRRDRDLVVDILIKVYQQNSMSDDRTVAIRGHAGYYAAFLGTQKAIQFLESVYEQEPNKWVQRGMMVGLALFCNREDILERYLNILRTDPEAASINIGYHLVYYGDQVREEGFYDRGGEKCDATLRSICRRLNNERYKKSWVLDLFTLRALLEQRGSVLLLSNEQYVSFILEFLGREHQEQNSTFHDERRRVQELLQGVTEQYDDRSGQIPVRDRSPQASETIRLVDGRH